VSSDDYVQLGSCCIAERRAIEMIEHGETRTDFMRFGDRVTISVSPLTCDGSLFGKVDQQVGIESQAR
jgi:fumarylacetoacetate (FAA) hydrolase